MKKFILFAQFSDTAIQLGPWPRILGRSGAIPHSSTMLMRFKTPLISFVLLAVAIAGVICWKCGNRQRLNLIAAWGFSDLATAALARGGTAGPEQQHVSERRSGRSMEPDVFRYHPLPGYLPHYLNAPETSGKRLSPNINYVFVTLAPGRDTPGKILKSTWRFLTPALSAYRGKRAP